MPLTQRLDADERSYVLPVLETYFAELAEQSLTIDAVTLFFAAAPGEPFRELARYPFSR